jgi:hypothetical protein
MDPFAFKKLGAIHEENPQGFLLGSIQAPVAKPSTYLLDPNGPFFTLNALMQFMSPHCGGYSLAQLVNFLAVLKGATPFDLSGSFDYAYEKTVDGVPNEDGTVITAIGKAGNNVGSCLQGLFPNDTATATDATPFSQASAQAKADALTRVLGTPFLLDDLSIEGIHQACYQNGGVILEVEVGNEWWTDESGATSWAPSVTCPVLPPKTVVDNHFILVAPYDEPNDRTWFINSWSKEWGQNGFGYFNSNYAPFIKAGIAFKQIPPSVHQALTANQISLAQQILQDLEQVLNLMGKEIGQVFPKVEQTN